MNQTPHLMIDGCDSVELAEKYGTPLYVLSLSHILSKVDELKQAFGDYPRFRIAYAGKAFLTLGMIDILKKLNLCLDVVSGGEFNTALQAGFPTENIEFNGNNKLDWELELAIKNNVGRIIVDGFQEVERIHRMAEKLQKKVSILFRLTPGVAGDSHDYIVTGKKDSKFGFPIGSRALEDSIDQALDSSFIDLLGFHMHVGSQLHDNEVYMKSLDILFDFFDSLHEQRGFIVKELNIGGGFGIRYNEEDEPKPYAFFIEPIIEKVKTYYSKRDWDLPELVTEPGRSIIGEAGTTLYRVGSLKDIEGLRYYVCVDGGMNDNIRPALYGAVYDAVLANKYHEPRDTTVTVTGKICESGDIIAKDILLAKPEVGDLLAVFSTGAYGYSMASNYNKLPVPAVALAYRGQSELMVRRQTLEDLNQYDLRPRMVDAL